MGKMKRKVFSFGNWRRSRQKMVKKCGRARFYLS